MRYTTHTLSTGRENFYNITSRARKTVVESGIQDGICVVFCPHTTAGIMLNENADSDVLSDMLQGLHHAYPENPAYCHMEGNTTAHLRATTVGTSVTVIVEQGELVLGEWQGIYFCEFDGPRNRIFYVKVIEG